MLANLCYNGGKIVQASNECQTISVYFSTRLGEHELDELDYTKVVSDYSNRPCEEISFNSLNSNLTCLNLSNVSNLLIPQSLKNLKFLEILNLSNTLFDNNSLKYLPKKHLSTLTLRNCKKLKYLSSSFKTFKQLECLDLSRSSVDSKSLDNLPSHLSLLALNRCRFIRDLPSSMKNLEEITVLQLMIPKLNFESLENIPTKRLENLSFHYDSTRYWGHHFDDSISAIYYGLTKSRGEYSGWIVKENKTWLENIFDSPALCTRVENYVKEHFNICRVYFGTDNTLIFDPEKGVKY